MLTALALVIGGVAAGGVPSLQIVMLSATLGLMVARIMVVVMEHGDTPVSDIHRRRIEVAWTVGMAALGHLAYMLLG